MVKIEGFLKMQDRIRRPERELMAVGAIIDRPAAVSCPCARPRRIRTTPLRASPERKTESVGADTIRQCRSGFALHPALGETVRPPCAGG